MSKTYYNIDKHSLQADFVKNFQIIEAKYVLDAISKKLLRKFNLPIDKIKGQCYNCSRSMIFIILAALDHK